MRKLKLNLEALNVESFSTRGGDGEAGTVHGRLNRADESTECDGGGWGSLFGTCEGCPSVGTCVGPTYCCPPTWRATCDPSCHVCTDPECTIFG